MALYQALQGMCDKGILKEMPLTDHVAAVSCGIYAGTPVLDLDYAEDSVAEADANFVLTGQGGIIEVQATAEKAPFSPAEFQALLELAQGGVQTLIALQKATLGIVD